MYDRIIEMRHLLGECAEGCGCGQPEKILGGAVIKSGKALRRLEKRAIESAELFSTQSVRDALEDVRESLECGCFEKMQEAVEALALAMCEAGCPPMQHINRKLGRCAKLPSDLHHYIQAAHAESQRARAPQEHQKAQQTMHDVARELQGAGFHQLAGLHAARSHAHKLAAAS